MTPLGRLIAARIRAAGPMRIDDYMRLCLMHPLHGYYATRDPFGAAGDFTTAPEISQMFGEIVGLALAQAWLDQGAPEPFVLAELGPGRGTLMADVLRACAGVPGLIRAARVHLVEGSAHLRAVQRDRLGAGVLHLDRADDLPEAPLFLIANEFFDALPIRQFQRVAGGWAERVVALDEAGGLRLALVPGAPAEEGADGCGKARAGRAGEGQTAMSGSGHAAGRATGPQGGQARGRAVRPEGPSDRPAGGPDAGPADRPAPACGRAADGRGDAAPISPTEAAPSDAAPTGPTDATDPAVAAGGGQGAVREYAAEARAVMATVAGRIARHGGAAIVIDYGGWDGRGDTLQALRAHAPDDPLAHPGEADLTAHVDFAPLARAAIAAGAVASDAVGQGEWLLSLGIAPRAARLAQSGDAGAAEALDRLTHPARMGHLFRALAVWPRGAPPVPGFAPLNTHRHP